MGWSAYGQGAGIGKLVRLSNPDAIGPSLSAGAAERYRPVGSSAIDYKEQGLSAVAASDPFLPSALSLYRPKQGLASTLHLTPCSAPGLRSGLALQQPGVRASLVTAVHPECAGGMKVLGFNHNRP